MSAADIRDYLSFIVLMGAAMTTILAFTPKGFAVTIKVFNWFDRNVWHKHVYAELHRLELRIDDLESLAVNSTELGGFE